MRTTLVGVATVVVVLAGYVVLHGLAAMGSGGPGSYAFLQTQSRGGGPVTYSSCRSIPVEFNLHGVKDVEATRHVLLAAMGEASAASHLNIVYVRDTARRPRPNWGTLQGYPVLIAFADASEIPAMDGVAGRGGSAWMNLNGRDTYVSGQIVLEKDYWNSELSSWHGEENTQGIVMHELGHVLGLAHVADSNEIMAKSGNGGDTWGPGDRRGLALLGQGPCS